VEGEDAALASRLLWLPARNDMDGTAALIAELDRVVTVDTSIGHLAGALGRPVWTLLPFASDWRWGISGRASSWYPRTRLFRQPAPGDWRSVVEEVRGALAESAGAPKER
jgi:ADP-heptose:LPS heptosyltransferase